jgi:MFS family permease
MSTVSRALRKAVASLVAALLGAMTGVAIMLLFGWPDWRVCLFMVGIFVVPVWLLVLLPLHVLLSPSSRFWRPLFSTGVGAVSGASLLTVYFAVSHEAPFDLIWVFLPIAVVVGGVTSFVGSALMRYCHGTRTA